MSRPYLRNLAQNGYLNEQEEADLNAAGVDSESTLLAAVESFPQLTPSGRGRMLIEQLNRQKVAAVRPAGAVLPRREPAWGALFPESSASRPGEIVFPAIRPSLLEKVAGIRPAGAVVQPLAQRSRIQWHLSGWPIANQGDRGTCVAFAITACREWRWKAQSSQHTVPRLSPQFLYWAARTLPSVSAPEGDGLLLDWAMAGLAERGICEETYWPYEPDFRPRDLTHGAPNLNALRNAGYYKSSFNRDGGGISAALVRDLLDHGPVAVALPVFRDPRTKITNWTTAVGWQHGLVLDPPPGTQVQDGGHAVCVTGFEPTPLEPMGGYFIFRNSWGTSWGVSPGVGGVPEPGYGRLSATYVETRCLEVAQV